MFFTLTGRLCARCSSLPERHRLVKRLSKSAAEGSNLRHTTVANISEQFRLAAKRRAKPLLIRVGSTCSSAVIHNLNAVVNYLHVGWWLRRHGFDSWRSVRNRFELFDHIAQDAAERDVLYLEFGVAGGTSIRYWANLLNNPRSRLHGFDSFLGLPHRWIDGYERGALSKDGRSPEIDDTRVEFFIGWFDQTFPTYVWTEHELLIAMLDADLYSSTVSALEFVRDRLRPGSYLIFDEFQHRGDELRAFSELLDGTEMTFRLVAATADLEKVAFQRIS
jgi:O-methyltransferase